MKTTIKYGHELSVAEFDSILDLDRRIFGNEIMTDEGLALERFLKSRDSIISAYSDKTLMGFICFYNVDPSVYQRALFDQEYIDDNLRANDVKPLTKEAGNHILMFDLGVDESFRHQGISKRLHELTWDFLKKKNDEGYAIDRIFGYAITPAGFRSMLSFGGREVWTRNDITFFEINTKTIMRLL